MAEQGDVVVGDVLVGDPAVSAVADVRLREQVVDQRVDLRPVRSDRGSVTPRLDEVEQQVGVDDVRAGEVELPGREVSGCGHAELVRGHATDMPRRLRRAEVRTVGERRQHVAQQWRGELRIRARGGPEPPPPLKPVRRPRKDLEHCPLRHPLLESFLQGQRAVRRLARAMALERRLSGLGVDYEIGVLRVLGINGRGLSGEPGPELVGERSGAARQAGLGAEVVKQSLVV